MGCKTGYNNMKWIYKEKPPLRIGDTRTSSVFLWFPTTAYCPFNGLKETRWLERALLTEVFTNGFYWSALRFETDPAEFRNGCYQSNNQSVPETE